MQKFYEKIKVAKPNTNAMNEARKFWSNFNNKGYSLGEMEDFVVRYAGMMGTATPVMPDKKAMLIMCGDHGIAQQGVSAYPQEVTIQMIKSYTRGYAAANIMAAHAKNDVYVVDMGVKEDLEVHPIIINKKVAYSTNDISKEAAMTEEQALKAIHSGYEVTIDLISKGYKMFVTAEMGIGNTTIAACIAGVFTGLDIDSIVGRGAGIGDKRFMHKKQLVAQALKLNNANPNDPLEVLYKLGGYEFAGMAGMIMACAEHGIPVFVDGVNATAAALVAEKLLPGCKEYMLSSHLSAEVAHLRMLKELELKPVVDANMRLGEGTGACLAINMLESALGVYSMLQNTIKS